jgi:transketolase
MLLGSEKRTADMRGAYGDTLVELGKDDSRIVCVGGDTTESLKTKKFGDKYPERMFNVGIAEANIVSVAAFIPGRCVDQIRNTICYPYLNVKLIVSHAGLTVGPDGASHQQIEDVAEMRAIPNMRVLVPADAVAVKYLIRMVASTPGPFYMRLARPSSEVIYADQSMSFELGRGNILEDGSDATIIGCGLMVSSALEAAKELKKKGISCRVVDMFSIKPIDKDLIARCAKETGAIATAEEHNVIGGLGGAVSEVIGETYPVPIKRVGVHDIFGESARDEEIDMLLEHYGMTAAEIAKAVLEARSRSRK